MKFGSLSVAKDESGRSVAFYVRSRPSVIGKAVFDAMKQWSRIHDDVDLRLCLHEHAEDIYQQMIILLHRLRYYRPHKEVTEESYSIYIGKMLVCTFSDQGDIKDTYLLHKNSPILRMKANVWHAAWPLTHIVIFQESKTGPWKRENLQFAPWAPQADTEGIAYMQDVLKRIHLYEYRQGHKS